MSQSPTEINHILESWGLSDLKAKFKANYIVVEALEFLTEADIIELIPKIGQRAIFRAKLNQWRQQKIQPPPPPPLPQPQQQQPTLVTQSGEIFIPEPKKIKLEPEPEDIHPLQQQHQELQLQQQDCLQQLQQLQQIQHLEQLARMEQKISQAKARLNRKSNGTPKNIIAKPTRTKKIIRVVSQPKLDDQQTIQSRVHKFFIGSASLPPNTPPTTITSITVTTPTTTTPTSTGSICRLPITSPNNSGHVPRLTIVNPITSPTMFYNSPQSVVHEQRRLPTIGRPRLTPQSNQSPGPTIRVIRPDNYNSPNVMTRIHSNAPNFETDLTPFATSIIRVETNDTGMPTNSTQNPQPKTKRTTIIQKLKDKNPTPLQTSPPAQKPPSIMPKPVVQLQKLSPDSKLLAGVGKSPTPIGNQSFGSSKSTIRVIRPQEVAVNKSPEVPKPRILIVPKKEAVEDESKTSDWNRFFEDKKKKIESIQMQPNSQQETESKEDDLEMDPDTNPEVEEITLAQLTDGIKDELLDSDSHSDADVDQDQSQQVDNDDSSHALVADSQDSQGDSLAESQEPKVDNEKLDIRKVLTNSRSGRKVIKRYVAEEIFDETIRRLLIETIAFHCFENKIHITPTYCKDIAHEIIEIFPNEKVEDYFHRKGKKLRSPLYTKFLGIKREYSRKEAIFASSGDKNTESKSTKDGDYDEDDNLIIS